MNNTFELVTDPATGKQFYESKEHQLQVAFSDLEEELNRMMQRLHAVLKAKAGDCQRIMN